MADRPETADEVRAEWRAYRENRLCGAKSGLAESKPGDTGPIICDRPKGHDGRHEGHDYDQSGKWNGWNARRSWEPRDD